MEPTPLGLTDHLTEAGMPFTRVALNCSYAPEALPALQPVQLVSMADVDGEIEKEPFGETEFVPGFDAVPAETPPPQPARTSRAGTNTSGKARSAACGRVRRLLRMIVDFPPAVKMGSLPFYTCR